MIKRKKTKSETMIHKHYTGLEVPVTLVTTVVLLLNDRNIRSMKDKILIIQYWV
jgi:hypothetical protein